MHNAAEAEIVDEMNKAFHNFSHLVYTTGRIINCSQELIDVDCAGVNGMSGSPIMWENKLVGLYVQDHTYQGKMSYGGSIKYS